MIYETLIDIYIKFYSRAEIGHSSLVFLEPRP